MYKTDVSYQRRTVAVTITGRRRPYLDCRRSLFIPIIGLRKNVITEEKRSDIFLINVFLRQSALGQVMRSDYLMGKKMWRHVKKLFFKHVSRG